MLRADGLSYDKISQQISVSKQTLISWSKKYEINILNFRRIKEEALKEEYGVLQHKRIQILGTILKSIIGEIKTRDLKEVSAENLIVLLMKLVEKLKEEEGKNIFFQSEPEVLEPDSAILDGMDVDQQLIIRRMMHRRIIGHIPLELSTMEELKGGKEKLNWPQTNEIISSPKLDQNPIPLEKKIKLTPKTNLQDIL